MSRISVSYLFAFLFLMNCTAPHQPAPSVHITGQMSDVMWKGLLGGNIALDTISQRTNLYGLGPVEYLTGEILIINGKSYKSTVAADSSIAMEETYRIKAPFFAYANIDKWSTTAIPDSVIGIAQLEKYLDAVTKHSPRPFMFKLPGTASHAKIHVVNLPEGSVVRSPDDAHHGRQYYKLVEEPVEIVGFFSTEHMGLFTHHDTFLHMHLINSDRTQMGHLDALKIKPGTAMLHLPV